MTTPVKGMARSDVRKKQESIAALMVACRECGELTNPPIRLCVHCYSKYLQAKW